jgi:hypothetical protein
VAKVVANLSGLARAMRRSGSLDSDGDLKDFTLGFTQAKASFDFVDVGYGKERADSKIRGSHPYSLSPGPRRRNAALPVADSLLSWQKPRDGTLETTTANKFCWECRTMPATPRF